MMKLHKGNMRNHIVGLGLVFVLSFMASVPILQGPGPLMTGAPLHGGIEEVERIKVFGAGLSKTGTTSMAAAFDMIGYNTLHTDRALSHFMHHANETADMTGWYDDVDSSWDIPTAGYYKEIYAAYPDAKFILTTRESESWYKSFEEFINGYMIYKWGCKVPIRVQRLHTKIYGSPFPNRDWIRTYEQHNEDVKEFFAQHAPEQLLVIDVYDSEKFEKICPFLGTRDGPCAGYMPSSGFLTSGGSGKGGGEGTFRSARHHRSHRSLGLFNNNKEKISFPHANDASDHDFKVSCPDIEAGIKPGMETPKPPKAPEDMKFAYVMLLCDPIYIDQAEYVRMLLVLKENIRQFDESSDVFVMVYGKIKGELRQLLKKEGFQVKSIPAVGSKVVSDPAPPIVDDQMAKCYSAKLRCLQLLEYDRVLFLDNDLLLNTGLDFMFRQNTTFVAYDGYGSPLNAGVFALQPSDQAFADISDIARSDGFHPDRGWLDVGPFKHWRPEEFDISDWSFWGASIDQGLLYYYYDKVLEDATILSRFDGNGLYTHFTGPNKPFMHDPTNLTSVGKRFRDGIIEWWRLWNIVDNRLNKKGLHFWNAFDNQNSTMMTIES